MGALIAHNDGAIDADESNEGQYNRCIEAALGQYAQNTIADQLRTAQQLRPKLQKGKSKSNICIKTDFTNMYLGAEES